VDPRCFINRQTFHAGYAVWWWFAFAASTPLYLAMLWQKRGMGEFFNPRSNPVLMLGLAGFVAMGVWMLMAWGTVLRRRQLPASSVQRAYLTLPLVAATALLLA